jgi:hypothetical protein
MKTPLVVLLVIVAGALGFLLIYSQQHDATAAPGQGHAASGGYGSAPASGGYGSAPAAGGYGSAPAAGGYGAAPKAGGYGTPPAAGGYGAPSKPLSGGYGK